MRSHLLVVVAAAIGCGETSSGPFQGLPLDVRFDKDVDGVVHIARDRFGIAHVYATTAGDLGYAQGYVMAHDRLVQMDLLRRYAAGTLAELYGSDDAAIRADITMRFHRMRPFAEETWNQLQVSAPDAELVTTLERFADGVNAYVDDAEAGRWSGLAVPPAFAPWTPVDSLMILRLFTFAQSWTVDTELAMTELDVRIRRAFPATPGLANDLLALAPIAPFVAAPSAPAGPANRPAVPDALFASARGFFDRTLPADVGRVLTPNALLRPYLGSNAFVAGDMLAADMHGTLANPSLFYPLHQIVEPEPGIITRNVAGLAVAGCPVIVAGTNGAVGWAPTIGTHDVNDIYLEQLVAGGTLSVHDGVMEPIATFTEEIRVGELGVIVGSRTETYEVVTRHGPVIPGHPPDAALAIRYTGYAPTHELSVLWELGAPTTVNVTSADSVLRRLTHGPHFMLVDTANIAAWTSYAEVPERGAAARAWSPANPEGAAPFFILDGTNPAHEWGPPLDLDVLPALASEPIVVADGDVTNSTADADPLNGMYFGVAYGNGLREARIRELLANAPVDAAALTRIQHDTRSTMGAAVRDALVTILRDAPEVATRSEAEQQQLALARDVLAAWDFETPIAAVSMDASSAATLLFNTWMVFFLRGAVDDELAAAGYAHRLDDDRAARIAYRLLADRDALVTAGSGEPLLCNTTCATVAIDAMVDAVTLLSANGRGPDDWRWGREHALRMRAWVPDVDGAYVLPRDDESALGFQRSGDMFAIDRADGGWDDALDFAPALGVAYRLQLARSGFIDALELRLELPTGTVFDPRDPHYRDLLEKSYLTRTPFVVPFSIADINRAGESRWELR